MTTSIRSSTSASRPSRPALAIVCALALVAVTNLGVGHRLRPLLTNSTLADVLELERRVDAFGAKQDVTTLVLGNSHALAALRPPELARACGLPPDAVFSLALPGESAHGAYLLARDQIPRFPQAHRALVMVDELLVGQAMAQERAERLATMGDWRERWRMVPWQVDLDGRVAVVIGAGLPILDQGKPLLESLAADPRAFADTLVTGEPLRATPGSPAARLRAAPFRWGYPPPWDVPGMMPASTARLRRRLFRPAALEKRAGFVTRQLDVVDWGLDDLDTLCRYLEARRITPVLVDAPMTDDLRDRLASPAHAAREALYHQALQASLQRTHRQVLRPPPLPREDFYDADHVLVTGARKLCAWLAASAGK